MTSRSVLRGTRGAAIGLAAWAIGTAVASAQVAVPTHDELAFDDEAPFVGREPVLYPHGGALNAEYGRVGTGHHTAIITGGNGPVPVVVTFLDADWRALAHREVLPVDATSICYDLGLGDLDGDGDDDLVVVRRLGDHMSPSFTDMVFVNVDPPWVGEQPTAPHFPLSAATPLAPDAALEIADIEADTGLPLTGLVDPVAWPGQHRQSHSVCLGDIDLDGDLDALTTGRDYGVRLWEGRGDATLTHRRTYVDDDVAAYAWLAGAAPPHQLMEAGYVREAALHDVDGDGDLDMVLARTHHRGPDACGSTRLRHDRVWFNRIEEGGRDMDPFEPSPQPTALQRPPLPAVTWRLVDLEDGSPYVPDGADDPLLPEGAYGGSASTFQIEGADLDLDGDLDLLAAHPHGLASAYRNQGTGGFGRLAAPTPAHPWNDGLPAHVFPSVTPDWSGSSDCLQDWIDYELLLMDCDGLPDPAAHGQPAFGYVFDVPGATLDRNTGVTAGDLDGDGLPEVLLSHRGDHQELCLLSGYDYLGGRQQAPPIYDVAFTNTSSGGECLSFHPVVELLSDPDDGTSYAKLIDVDLDGRLDWLDANWANQVNGDSNRLYWGLPLARRRDLTACGQVDVQPLTDGGLELDLTFGADRAGDAVVVLLHGGPAAPAVPSSHDAGLDTVVRSLGTALRVEGAAPASLDDRGHALITVRLPPKLDVGRGAARAWLTVVAHRDGAVTAVSNAVGLDGPR